MTLRALHVIPAVAPRYGGPSTAIVQMTAALAAIPGVAVEVAATDADGSASKYDGASWPVPSVPLHLFPTEGPERYKKSAGLWNWLDANIPRFDVVHTHAAWNFPTYAACRLAAKHRKPLVYRPCGTLSAYTWGLKRPLKWAYWLWRERANVAGAAAFHCTSDAEATEVKAHQAARGRVEVIPLGVDPAAWTVPVDAGELRRRCGPKAGDLPIVLFLSRLHPKKGIVDTLLPAFARVRTRAFLAIAGGADEHAPAYESEIRREVERLKLNDRVAMLGPVTATERWAMYDGAALFVLPSHRENFGIVVVEALARGCPALVTPDTATGEYVLSSKAGNVVPRDVASFAVAIDELLAEGRSRGEAGLIAIREQLSWERTAGRLVGVYRKSNRFPLGAK